MAETKKYETFGKRLKECRLEKELTTKEMAYILGVKEAIYLSYEAGERDIKLRKLGLLSHLLHASCDYLLGLSDVKWPPVYKGPCD